MSIPEAEPPLGFKPSLYGGTVPSIVTVEYGLPLLPSGPGGLPLDAQPTKRLAEV